MKMKEFEKLKEMSTEVREDMHDIYYIYGYSSESEAAFFIKEDKDDGYHDIGCQNYDYLINKTYVYPMNQIVVPLTFVDLEKRKGAGVSEVINTESAAVYKIEHICREYVVLTNQNEAISVNYDELMQYKFSNGKDCFKIVSRGAGNTVEKQV